MTPRSGADTREKLLDTAEEMILARGYAATSIDQIIEQVGLTKGTFFYHFKTKQELARALIERFARLDEQVLRGNMERAEKLSSDPLQQLLIFVGLMIEVVEDLDNAERPGCLFATYCYESGLFEDEIKEIIRLAILKWRTALVDKLEAAAAKHPPKSDVDFVSLADLLTGIFEGAYILSRSLGGPNVFTSQLGHYRTYLELLFDA